MAKAIVSASELVKDAKGRIENLSVEQAAEQISQPGTLLVDIRDAGELAASGSIPGSVNVPRGMLEFRADPSSPYHDPNFDPERRIVLHCASGGRSALAADTLQKMGYTNVAHMDGGMKAWTEAGKPVTRENPAG